MITVIHYSSNKDPDIWFGIDEKTENSLLNGLKSDWNITRSSPEEWYGQDNPEYMVHHYKAIRKK